MRQAGGVHGVRPIQVAPQQAGDPLLPLARPIRKL
jgi:hypothetical protein